MIKKYFVIFLCLMCTFTPPAMAGECTCASNNGTDCGSVTCGDTTCTHDTCDGIDSWSLTCAENEYATLNGDIYYCAQCPRSYSHRGVDTVYWDFATQELSKSVSDCTMTTVIYDDEVETGIAIDMTYNTKAPQILDKYVYNALDIRELINKAKKNHPNDIFMGLYDDKGRQIYDKDLEPTNNVWISEINQLHIKFKEFEWDITICFDETDTNNDGICDNKTNYSVTKTNAKSINPPYKFGYTFMGACTPKQDTDSGAESEQKCYDKDGKANNTWYSDITPETPSKITMYADFEPIELTFQFKCTPDSAAEHTLTTKFDETLTNADISSLTKCNNYQIGWQIYDPEEYVLCENACKTRTYFPYNGQNLDQDYSLHIDMFSYEDIIFIPLNALTFIDNNGTFILQ